MENPQYQEPSLQAKHNLEEVRFALAFLNHSIHLCQSQTEAMLPLEGSLEGMDVVFSWVDEKLEKLLI